MYFSRNDTPTYSSNPTTYTAYGELSFIHMLYGKLPAQPPSFSNTLTILFTRFLLEQDIYPSDKLFTHIPKFSLLYFQVSNYTYHSRLQFLSEVHICNIKLFL